MNRTPLCISRASIRGQLTSSPGGSYQSHRDCTAKHLPTWLWAGGATCNCCATWSGCSAVAPMECFASVSTRSDRRGHPLGMSGAYGRSRETSCGVLTRGSVSGDEDPLFAYPKLFDRHSIGAPFAQRFVERYFANARCIQRIDESTKVDRDH